MVRKVPAQIIEMNKPRKLLFYFCYFCVAQVLEAQSIAKSIYYIEENANVVGVGTDISFKICCGR
jgi:hypothetical protein